MPSESKSAKHSREWRKAHPEYQHDWARTHRKQAIKHTLKWQQAHPGYGTKQKRKWREAHREQHLKSQSDWSKAHPGYYIEHNRQWRKAHPDEARLNQRRHRARMLGNGGSHSVEEWRAKCDEWGNKCLHCGTTKRLTCDHIKPLSRGGRNDIENLQLLCHSCNCHKSTKTIDYRP